MTVTIVHTAVKPHDSSRPLAADKGDANGQGTHVAGWVDARAPQSRTTAHVPVIDTGADAFDRGQSQRVAGGASVAIFATGIAAIAGKGDTNGQGTHVAGVSSLGGTGMAAAVVSGRAAAYLLALKNQGVPHAEAVALTRQWLQQK